MLNEWVVILSALGFLVTLVSFMWKFHSSQNKQILDLKDTMIQIKEQLLNKLEYHERHDDRRFSDMGDNIWMLRLRNAAKDGLKADQWLEDLKKKNYPLNELNESL